jgi:hypothetical protein
MLRITARTFSIDSRISVDLVDTIDASAVTASTAIDAMETRRADEPMDTSVNEDVDARAVAAHSTYAAAEAAMHTTTATVTETHTETPEQRRRADSVSRSVISIVEEMIVDLMIVYSWQRA